MSRPWQLTEPVIRALQARLEQDLPAQLDAIAADVDAQGEDLVMLRPPAHVYDFIPSAGYLTDFPVVAVGDWRSEIVDDTGSSATGRHELAIVVYHAHVELPVLVWGLRRYAQAVVAVSLRGRTLGTDDDRAWGLEAGELQPGPTLESDGGEPRTLMSFTGLRLIARRDEL